jgi:thiol-disulfide isomerase/thioredoxin
MNIAQGEVVTGFPNRQAFLHLLESNHPGIVVKFTATWCGPCKKIDHLVQPFFKNNCNKILCCHLDVDENHDLYSFMKSKKMANGIPTLLYYHSSNHNYIPNASISGSNEAQVRHFFSQVI